jgi:hypothetical protein
MPFFGMLHPVPVVRTDISKEHITSRVKGIDELGTTLAVTSNRSTLRLLVTANVALSLPIFVNVMIGR